MNTPNTSRLFSSFNLGTLSLKNRMVMAPLTRSRGNAGDVAHELQALYYSQRASAGLIISEGSQISPQGKGYPFTPGIHSAAQIEGWKKVTRAVHEKNGRIFLQLWHVGRISHPLVQPGGALPVGPSAIKAEGQIFTEDGMKDFVVPHALGIDEIRAVVQQYRMAAENALAAGFDGVEIHAANGYLIDQFLRDSSNHRDDAYGGSIENRVRFLLEITEAVSQACTPGRVGVRISPTNGFNTMHDSDPGALFGHVARELGRQSIAYLHAVEEDGTRKIPRTDFDWLALRRAFGGVYIANGGYTRDRAEAALDRGDADLIAFGKLFLANPDLPHRFATDAPLNAPRPEKFYAGGAEGYTDYPFLDDTQVPA